MNTDHTDNMAINRGDVLTRTLELIDEHKEMSRRAREMIARENLASAETGPGPTDQRLLVIEEIVRRLQGTLITPEDRTALLAFGRTRGVRCFDMNLLIAMVQDRVRRGERPAGLELAHTRAPSPSSGGTVRVIDPASRVVLRLIMALLGAAALTMLAAGWLTN
jgi:hypothetical protein